MRIWEIDAWRSLALCFMIFFHILVDLRDLFSYPIDYHQGFWRFYRRFCRSKFHSAGRRFFYPQPLLLAPRPAHFTGRRRRIGRHLVVGPRHLCSLSAFCTF